MRITDAMSLASYERKILRRIFGTIKTSDAEYRRRYNQEIYKLYGDMDIISYIKIGRLRWLGHINRMEEDQ